MEWWKVLGRGGDVWTKVLSFEIKKKSHFPYKSHKSVSELNQQDFHPQSYFLSLSATSSFFGMYFFWSGASQIYIPSHEGTWELTLGK